MGAYEALHGMLEYETERSLEPWRHELTTRLDDMLFLADDSFSRQRNDSRLTELAMASAKQELFEQIRQYVQNESVLVPGGPDAGDPVKASGRLYWHYYDYRRQKHTTQILPAGYSLTGHYDGCDALAYIDSCYLEGDDELARTKNPVTRAVGVHMMLTVPAVVSETGDDALLLSDVDRVYIPLHYPRSRFTTAANSPRL